MSSARALTDRYVSNCSDQRVIFVDPNQRSELLKKQFVRDILFIIYIELVR